MIKAFQLKNLHRYCKVLHGFFLCILKHLLAQKMLLLIEETFCHLHANQCKVEQPITNRWPITNQGSNHVTYWF
jgi:hypothetical protein